MRTIWMTVTLVLVTVAVAVAQSDQTKTAEEFVKRFVERSIGDMAELYTPEMKAAFSPERAVDIVDGLEKQHGPVQSVGEGWFEDNVQGYRRYRVPVVFEQTTLDVRVIFDARDRIAGIFIARHSEKPVERDTPGVEREVTIGEPGLPGTLTLPEAQGLFPAVVLVHGSGPQDRDGTVGPNKPLRDIAWGLAERGIASLRYEKRSRKYPGDLAAHGETLTVEYEVIADARAAVELLQKSYGINPDRVYIAGHSLGGHLAPRVAVEGPRPAGVIILAGSTLPLPEKMLEQQTYIFGLDGEISEMEQNSLNTLTEQVALIRAGIEGTQDVTGFHLGAPIGYYKDLETHDTPGIMAGLGIPCLVIQGGRDYQVTMDDFKLWQDALSGKRHVCLRVFDKLDHLLREGEGQPSPSDYDVAVPVSAEMLDCIAAWIKTGACCSK